MDFRALLQVGVILAASAGITPGQLQELKAEAAQIWQPYGVHFTWLESIEDECGPDGAYDLLVQLRPDQSGMQRAHRLLEPPLGSVRFNATSDHNVFLAAGEIRRMVLESPLADVPVSTWSLPVRDRMVGRAYGRVFSHEIGHLLLGLPTHDTTGLMRTSFSVRDLVAPGHEHLTIGRRLMIRLQERLMLLRNGGASP